MARLRYNGLTAILGGSGLTGSATAITFAAALTHSGGTAVPTISGGDHIPLSLFDSDGVLKEVVYLTAYTSGGTSGTISRGQEGTTGVSHSAGTSITHSPLVSDVGTGVFLLEHGATPTGVPEGAIIYYKAPGPVTYDFRLGSLPSGWASRGTPTSVSFDSSGMTATYPSGAAHYIDAPTGTSTDMVVRARVLAGSGSGVMMGPMLQAATGYGAMAGWYSGEAGLINAGVGTDNGYASGSFTSTSGSISYPIWHRIRKSGTNYYGAYSTNGTTWTETVGLSRPTTPASRISFGSIFGTATGAKVEQIIYQGGVGGLQGWWDGTQIVSF